LENYRLIAATHTAAIATVKASPDISVGNQLVKYGFDITSSTIPVANAIPPTSDDTRTPVIFPLIDDQESDDPTRVKVVINVPKYVSRPMPIKIDVPHENILLEPEAAD
jgi:hypothetical protein